MSINFVLPACINSVNESLSFDLINNTNIKTKYRLALTGTYPHGNTTVEELYPIVDIITEDEAIKEGWISKYREYNIKLELEDDDKEQYYK